MDYHRFSVEDFIADEYFIKWVKEPDEAVSRFWDEWLSLHPEKKACIEEARRAVLQLSGMELITPPAGRLEEVKEAIDRRIENSNSLKVVTLKKGKWGKPAARLRQRVYRYAAVVTGLLMLGAAAYFLAERITLTDKYVTGFGETRTLTLPDNSKVILNANSEVRYTRNWRSGKAREVWLSGEAFFSVERTGTPWKFIVHTDDVEVEVLGTKFNVNNRESNTKVVLNSGKIKLSLPGGQDTSSIIMKPGELVEYISKERKIVKEEVVAGNYISWINNELVLDNTPLREISETLENNYGITLILIDEELAARTITATLPTDDVDFILRALSETLDLKVTQRDEQVYIVKSNTDEMNR